MIETRISARFPDANWVPCYWGDRYGAALAWQGVSIPRRETARGGDASLSGPFEQEAAHWLLLLADPLCELRVLGPLFASGEELLGMPGVRAPGEAVAERVLLLTEELPDEELLTLLDDTELSDSLPEAAARVYESAELSEACEAASDEYAVNELTVVAARAVVAQALHDAGDEAMCTGDERDRIVDLVSARLGGIGRFPGGRAASALGSLALRLTTQPALNHWRVPLTTGGVPAIGDILRYQTRGTPLRDHLRELIAADHEPTVVIGHSLGGIALVDVLAQAAVENKALHHVRLLVTVGSQAPFLHELGALSSLPPAAPLPPGFPRWLNVYDRGDLLSFRAVPVFGADVGVVDFEMSSRQPFPLSHSAYWKQASLYERIADEIEAMR